MQKTKETDIHKELESFCKDMPKIELHAHLSGSISPQCLHEIWLNRKQDDTGLDLQDPLEVMSAEKQWDLESFFPLFSTYIYALCSTSATLRYATTSVLQDFAEAGVIYFELRSTPRAFPSTGLSKQVYVETVLDAISQFEAKEDTQMRTKLILSIDRRDSEEKAQECVNLAIEYMSHGVVGVDLCGDPLKGEIPLFAPIFNKAKAAGLKLTLHFAETAATSSDADLLTLLSFNPERLGHVIHVSSAIKEEINKRKLGLELCVSCNVKAKMMVKTSGSFADHHFREWWEGRSGCPVILCTDDVGVFGSPIWNEYLLVASHFGLTKDELWRLSFGSVEAIFADDHEKERIKRIMLKWKEEKLRITL